ncbi:beta-glucosidase [Haloferula helveola]|uniref:Beta-glucosidase n=1 Tax=Haloferula helveola TaxID=490095 RepID=A0ABN6HE14_9BACT|nr:beta-glucosidase [Haloferula helveola]
MRFPEGFTWGTATSAYQIEGGHDADGKGPSIWDAFCQVPGRVAEGDTGQLACDHYHRFREDVALMASLGLKAYRFSISWPRVMPTGRLEKGSIKREGIRFYSDLIDALLEHGIEPWVTLYHWDLPLALQTERDGWLNPEIADDFEAYARLCFEEFGDRVKHWITFNEPWVVTILGYGQGVFAPGRESNVEPYIAGHHILRSHAKAVQCYRSEFEHQGGKIGITNNCDWREPLTDRPEDHEAAERALLFYLGWFADPVFKTGDYPEVMRERVGDRLPEFTDEERRSLLGSSDFFGLNHYTTMFAAGASKDGAEQSVYGNGGISEDQEVDLSVDPEWELTEFKWAVVPWGCRKLLKWIADRYGSPAIYITENGCAMDDVVLPDGTVDDQDRLSFYRGYLEACHQAIGDGVDLRGYFAWSLMDNFEWASGYKFRFGLVHVDRQTLKRTPKSSALWYSDVVRANELQGEAPSRCLG